MIKTALTAASIALVATAAPAIAGPLDAPTQKVSFADLDLSTPEGQAALDRRIDAAARDVCHLDDMRTGTRLKAQERKRCYAKARASAENQVAAIIEDRQRGG